MKTLIIIASTMGFAHLAMADAISCKTDLGQIISISIDLGKAKQNLENAKQAGTPQDQIDFLESRVNFFNQYLKAKVEPFQQNCIGN